MFCCVRAYAAVGFLCTHEMCIRDRLFRLSEKVVITLVVVCITPLSLRVASFLAKRSYK